ncbi:MAG: TRAP transporter small permease [Dethiobacter sp.]|jgi:TRAP-type C4-dicarboxylate transport system permease small subunit|nr:MAG: TRAP transporter small permease [Dethiobacter sp.]
MGILDKFVRMITWRTAQIGQAALAAVMLLIVANIFSRIPWKPVPGTVELTEILGAVLLTTGVAYTQLMKGHIFVGVLVEKFPPRLQGVVDTIVSAISLFFAGLLAKETIAFGAKMAQRGWATADLLIPIYPVIYLVAFGFLMLAVVLLKDLIKAIMMIIKGSEAL